MFIFLNLWKDMIWNKNVLLKQNVYQYIYNYVENDYHTDKW